MLQGAVETSFVDQHVVANFGKRMIDLAEEAGVPKEDVERSRREIKGGTCPLCQAEYRKVHVKNRYADFVYFVPSCGCEDKNRSDAERRRREDTMARWGKIPPALRHCDIESWDYGVKPETNQSFKWVLEYIKERRYKKEGLICYGMVGTGKTYCAVAVLRAMVREGMSIRFVATSDLVNELMQHGDEVQRQIEGADAVLLDDMDKIGTTTSAWVRERVFSIVNNRIAAGKIILATTNFTDPMEFTQKWGEAVTSRLVASCFMVEFKGDDYRMKQRELRKADKENRRPR